MTVSHDERRGQRARARTRIGATKAARDQHPPPAHPVGQDHEDDGEDDPDPHDRPATPWAASRWRRTRRRRRSTVWVNSVLQVADDEPGPRPAARGRGRPGRRGGRAAPTRAGGRWTAGGRCAASGLRTSGQRTASPNHGMARWYVGGLGDRAVAVGLHERPLVPAERALCLDERCPAAVWTARRTRSSRGCERARGSAGSAPDQRAASRGHPAEHTGGPMDSHRRAARPVPLAGTVAVGGAKNSVLKLMAAAILAEGTYMLDNVPGHRRRRAS